MKFVASKISLVALAIVLVAGVAIAQRPGGPRGGGDFFGGPMLGFFADYLDLSDAQQAQIKQIMAKEKPALEPLFQQEMQSHEQMMQLIQSGTFDEAKATAIANQGAQIHAQLEVQPQRRTRFSLQSRRPSWLSSSPSASSGSSNICRSREPTRNKRPISNLF
jgi:Spy/CpxP family protein refolding chaperone